MALQSLTLTLEGITAGDYLQWVREPEPPTLGQTLRSVEVDGDPLGQTVEAVLRWNGSSPPAIEAGPAAGLPLTPEVIAVESTPLTKERKRSTTASCTSVPERVRSFGLSATPTRSGDMRDHRPRPGV